MLLSNLVKPIFQFMIQPFVVAALNELLFDLLVAEFVHCLGFRLLEPVYHATVSRCLRILLLR